ncbi:hypothetical protein A4S06_11675 [Erysipelotrichaceae bacterium MTC7]|nr:hypothetical protein A4S06_11675 [Erysipelotrichaceae bacterium MTC7]
MKYFTNEGMLYKTEMEIKEKDYVVVSDGFDRIPYCIIVEKIIDEYDALTAYDCVHEVIDVVDMQSYRERRESEVRRKTLLSKMDNEMRNIKAMETLEKYAGKSEVMAELHTEFKKLGDKQ